MKVLIIGWMIAISLLFCFYVGKFESMLEKHHEMMIVGMCAVGDSIDEFNK